MPEGASADAADGGAEKRKFTVRFDDGEEEHLFHASHPGAAARKAARAMIDPNGYTDPQTAAENNSLRIYLREIGTRTLYVYDCYTWVHDDACPECGGRRVDYRKTKAPAYRCASCGAEFDEPAALEDVELRDDIPDYLDHTGELTHIQVESRGRSKVPKSEIKLAEE